MRRTLQIVVVIFSLLGLFIFHHRTTYKKAGSRIENCLLCHGDTPSPDKNHDVRAIGCSSCHLGNPYAVDKSMAHENMVLNPASYPFVEKTCGKSNCHPDQVKRVKNSIMATNRGIINTLRYQWGEVESTFDTLDIYSIKNTSMSPAISHYRKFCSTCHIWKKLHDLPGEIGSRGGGCIDCHLEKKHGHNGLTVKIRSRQCIKCHNRSARTGLSYRGIFESEGYGTPFYRGRPNRKRKLSGGRFFRRLLPDIHYEYGLECIDCHTSRGLMGDGSSHYHVEDQVEISCQDCHDPIFEEVSDGDSAMILASLNGLKLEAGDSVAITRKSHFPLYNVHLKDGDVLLIRKIDGKVIPIVKMSQSAYHRISGHEQLSCQACHSAWVPQCYGCHDIYRKSVKQLDKISYKRTWGKWEERRSYLRYEHPVLMRRPDGKVYPAAPGCQVYLTALDKNGRVDSSATHFAMAFFDPHTTRRAVRSCQDCHLNPKTVGLGSGSIRIEGKSIEFTPIYDAERSELKIPLESVIDTAGRQIQRVSRENARFFSLTEIKKIFTVGYCIQCHRNYEDGIYKSFRKSFKDFEKGLCPAGR